MAQMTKDDIKKLVKEAVREVFKENSLITDMMSECIRVSVLTILKEVNTMEITESRRAPQAEAQTSFFQETPLVTPASKIKVGQRKPTPPPITEQTEIFNRDIITRMFEEEVLGLDPNKKPIASGKVNLSDMNDTLEDDPRVLKALGIRV